MINRRLIKSVMKDSLESVDTVKSIARSFRLDPGCDFHYVKLYRKHRIFTCSTHEALISNYCDLLDRNPPEAHFLENDKIFDNRSFIYSAHDPNITVEDNQFTKLACDHGLTGSLAVKSHDEKSKITELFVFLINTTRLIRIDELKEKLHELTSFCLAFKDQAHKLIASREIPANKIDHLLTHSALNKDHETRAVGSNISQPEWNIKRYYLGAPFGNNYLTQKEFDCLKLFFLGRTAKQIARELGDVSYRTVEKHLMSIKSKTTCDDISELRPALLENIFFAHELKRPRILM